MKQFEELCAIIQKIAADPYAEVDYLTISDFLQLRQHLDICKDCDKLSEETVERGEKEGKLTKEGGPSAN